MKTLVILIVTGILTGHLHAQQTVYTANIDFYAGTWKYENRQTGEEFVLKLRKTTYSVLKTTSECVVGAYTYKKNGQTVTDCMDQFSLDILRVLMPVFATNSNIDQSLMNPNKLRMIIADFGKFCPNGDVKRTGSNELLLVSNASPDKIRWILKNDEGEYLTDELPPREFSIPTDMILTRQSE